MARGALVTTPVLSTAKLALEHLFERIVAETAERLPDAPPSCVFGWREAAMQINQAPAGAARIVLAPGDATGKVGDLASAKLPGRNPAPLATMVELATLNLWAYDPSDPSELAQWRAARRLHDLVIPIVIRNFGGCWKQVSKQWLRPEVENPFGAELQVVIAVEALIPDDVRPEAPGGTVTTLHTTIASLSGSGTPNDC